MRVLVFDTGFMRIDFHVQFGVFIQWKPYLSREEHPQQLACVFEDMANLAVMRFRRKWGVGVGASVRGKPGVGVAVLVYPSKILCLSLSFSVVSG